MQLKRAIQITQNKQNKLLSAMDPNKLNTPEYALSWITNVFLL
jgi:hypothetical protein